jgi:DNA polymerase I
VAESSLAGVQLHLISSISDVLECREWVSQQRGTPLAFDTETTGLSPQKDRVRLLQIGDEMHGWAFPFEWAGAAIEMMRDYDGDFVAHNSSFDLRHLRSTFNYQVPWHKVHDTMTIAALTDPTRPKGLKPLSARIIDPRAVMGQKLLDDGMKNNGWTWATVPADFPPYWAYAALDPVLTARIYAALAPAVFETSPEAYDLERAVTPILASMMDHGLLLDREYTKANLAKLRQSGEQMRAWLSDYHGVTSLMSAKQIDTALRSQGVEVSGRTASGLPSITKEVLDAVAVSEETSEAARTLARTILRARHAEKLAGTYLENFLEIMASDGAIHPSINQLMARTSRMSCQDPNLQNLPRDDRIVRGCFIPRPGYVFITCDASQIELRLIASLSNDENLIRTIKEADENGTDIYAGMASAIHGEAINKKDHRRQHLKSAVYCRAYGGGVNKIAKTIGLPLSQAKQLNDMISGQFPRLDGYAGELIATSRRQQAAGEIPHVRTDTGRYLPLDASRAYSAVNYVCQATAAEELKRAMTRLASAGLGDMLRLPVHDEVIMECPVDDASEVLKLVENTVREDDRFRVSIPWEGAILPTRWIKGLAVSYQKATCSRDNCNEVNAPGSSRYCQEHRDEMLQKRNQPKKCKRSDCDEPKDLGVSHLFCHEHALESIAKRPFRRKRKSPPTLRMIDGRCFSGCQCGRHSPEHRPNCVCKTCQMKRGDISPEYHYLHAVVRRERGKAIGYQCVDFDKNDDCGKQARHWSTIHGKDGTDIWNHYEPRCIPCHMKYDDVGANWRGKEFSQSHREHIRDSQAARSKEERSEAAKLAWETRRENGTDRMTRAQKTKISAALSGHVVSEESRRKASQSHKGRKRTKKQKLTIKEAQQRRKKCNRGPFNGPDGKFMSRMIYEAEVGQSCEI